MSLIFIVFDLRYKTHRGYEGFLCQRNVKFEDIPAANLEISQYGAMLNSEWVSFVVFY